MVIQEEMELIQEEDSYEDDLFSSWEDLLLNSFSSTEGDGLGRGEGDEGGGGLASLDIDRRIRLIGVH